MNAFDEELHARLDHLRDQGLRRQLRPVDSPQGTHLTVQGRPFLNFSSNDYLGLANEPAIKEAAKNALEKFGAGSGASRLICGSLAPHHELEENLARFKGVEAALAFSSGYATAAGVIGALLDSQDVIIVDKLVHACVVDAARLCRAKLRVFAHNDLNDLEKILRWADTRDAEAAAAARRPRVLIVTESVFSMDGDQAPLRGLVDLKDRFGAWLMVDEAHATGLFGRQRRGLAEECGVAHRIEVQMGTLGKALGSAGGYVCGSRALIDYLINTARSFIFSTAPVPAAAAAATAAIRFVESAEGEQRRNRLWENIELFRKSEFWRSDLPGARPPPSGPIAPIIIGPEARAVEIADGLRDRGIFIPAIRYPTVPRGEARLRLTLCATHAGEDITRLSRALVAAVK
jgi:8-amino-7-oxononanoate synthase